MEFTTKTEIRKNYLKKRDALDAAERKRDSSLIQQKVLQHPKWHSSETVLCYISLGSEVYTHALIEEALRLKKRVVVPQHDPARQDTPLSELRQFADLGSVHRGVLQVRSEFFRPADPATIDLVLIPGIAFDREGGRIGFGGGYFDRLLPQMPQAFRMALAFSSQLYPKSLPLETHDIQMQTIVTETEALVALLQ